MDNNIEKLVRKGIKKISPYVPGKPMEELNRAYGLDIEKIVKLASNENPLGPSPKAIKAMKASAGKISRYPEGSGYYLKNKIAKATGCAPENIILGSGSSEILSLVMETFINEGEEVVYPSPSFSIYKILALKVGASPIEVPLNPDFSYNIDMFLKKITSRTRVIILCNPNNPTGTIIYHDQMESFIESVPDSVIIISDEAYREYVEDENFGTAYPYFKGKNVIIVRTFSKIYGLAGLRIGYGMAQSEIIGFMERIRPPFNTTTPAQEAALVAIDDEEHIKRSFKNNSKGKVYLYNELKNIGVEYIPTQANFILCRFKKNAGEIIKKLEEQGIIIRGIPEIGPEYARITIGTPKENRLLIENLRQLL